MTIQTLNIKQSFTRTGFILPILPFKRSTDQSNSLIRKNLMKQLFISLPEIISDENSNGKRKIELKFKKFDMPFYLTVDNISNYMELFQNKTLLSDQTEVCQIILNKVS